MPKRIKLPESKIAELYQAGKSSFQIAESLKVSAPTIIRRLKGLGIQRREPKEVCRLRKESGRWTAPRYWLGKKQPQEMIENRTSKIKGAKHYLWKGGKSKRDYRRVLIKIKCADCGSKLNLGIHHKNLDHYDNRPENLEVLCVSCHMRLHKKLYWEAKRNGKPIPKSNSPIGWRR